MKSARKNMPGTYIVNTREEGDWGVQGQKQNFSPFVIMFCYSSTHGLSKMGSLSSELPTVAEIWVAEDTLFSRVLDIFYKKRPK